MNRIRYAVEGAIGDMAWRTGRLARVGIARLRGHRLMSASEYWGEVERYGRQKRTLEAQEEDERFRRFRQAEERPSDMPPWLVPLIRWMRSIQVADAVTLSNTVARLRAADATPGRQRILDATMGAIRRDVHRRFPYESIWRVAANRARRAVEMALSDIHGYSWTPDAPLEYVYDGAVEMALIRTLAYDLSRDEFEALWGPYERALPDLYRFRHEAFVFETVDELENVLRMSGLAEVIIMEGGVPRDTWNLQCPSCGEEFVPFGWHEWRRSVCDFCQRCPTVAFVEPAKSGVGETVQFMRVFPAGGFDAVWPPS